MTSDKLDNYEFETINVIYNESIDNVATVELDRPSAKNALNKLLRQELKDALNILENDEDVKVTILTGCSEGGAFAAGADVNELHERSALDQRSASQRPRIYETVSNHQQPVIARVNGHALGGGCELALACDMRIAHENAKFGQPEINLGIMPGGGATQRLPRLIGDGQAMRLILTGEIIDAGEAADIGLVDEVYDDGEFDDRVNQIAGMMAAKSPLALRYAKRAVKASSSMSLKEGIEYEVELFLHLFGTDDKCEGFEAFLENRDPEWKGR